MDRLTTKRIRSQTIDVEKYLNEIKNYLSKIEIKPIKQIDGRPPRLCLIHLPREQESFDRTAYTIRRILREYKNSLNIDDPHWMNLIKNLKYIYDQILNTVTVLESEKAENFISQIRDLGKIVDINESIVTKKELDKFRLEILQRKENLNAAITAVEVRESDEIYFGLSQKYEKDFKKNNRLFFISITFMVLITVLIVFLFSEVEFLFREMLIFFSLKILIIAVGITLCSLFLKRAAHANKMKDKADQIHAEIRALPLFIRSLDDKNRNDITKELALRYFGKDLDQTQNDKIGDLIQDSLKISMDTVKTAHELVKNSADSKDKSN